MKLVVRTSIFVHLAGGEAGTSNKPRSDTGIPEVNTGEHQLASAYINDELGSYAGSEERSWGEKTV